MKEETKQENSCSALTSIDWLCPDVVTHLDLFAGIGGFSLAAKWLGWQTVGFVEKDGFCQKVLRKNFGQDIKIYDDIKEFSGKSFHGTNVITGGFPCQDISIAGKQAGLGGARSGLWREMYRVITEVRPDWVVVENVGQFVRLGLDEVLDDLEAANYASRTFVIPAASVGAWHKRERVWIVSDNLLTRGIRDGRRGRIGRRRESENKTSRYGWNEASQRNVLWDVEPELGRVVYGIPNQSHRINRLGNSIVPQIAYEILSAIRDVECQRAGT